MNGRAASLLGAKRYELEKEVPRFMLAVGAGPAPHSLGAQEGRAESPHAAPAQPSLLAGGEEGFCLCMAESYSWCHSSKGFADYRA